MYFFKIMECSVQPLLKNSLFFVGTIFAYGQSSSGKTFTMTGSNMQPGIIKLAVNEIFSRINNVRKKLIEIILQIVPCFKLMNIGGSYIILPLKRLPSCTEIEFWVPGHLCQILLSIIYM